MKKFLIPAVLVLVLMFFGGIMAFAANQTDVESDPAYNVVESGNPVGEVFLYTGSPLLLSGNGISPLDPDNLDVAATVIDGHTLVPLRAISEYFSAEVSYAAATKSAVIDYNGKTYIFPVNDKKYYISVGSVNEEKVTDSATMILNQRTMVPLRVIVEDVLGLEVDYSNHVIAINSGELDDDVIMEIKSKIGMAVKVQTISELEQAVNNDNGSGYGDDAVKFEEPEASFDTSTTTNEAAAADSDTGASYSETNTQVEGIDEADIVKTDGEYIYIAGNNAVRIVKTVSGKLSEAAIIKLDQNKTVQEIYIDGDRLILLGNRYEDSIYQGGDVRIQVESAVDSIGMVMPYYNKTYSFMDVYDITDPGDPAFLKGHEMEGYYQSSRKNGEIVYMITNCYISNYNVLPAMKYTLPAKETDLTLALNDVLVIPDYPAYTYLVVSALDIHDSNNANVEAIAAAGQLVYMNDNALYLASSGYYNESPIIKFSIDGKNIGYAGSGMVDGYLLNQFSMDEADGYLRVATTTWENGNNLFVLDDSLDIVGSVKGYAQDERIYSVRFIGNKGYVVTFRNMDPLFVFDLSDPENPQITGELEVPGFSNYLHPVGEDLILGIGQETYNIYKKDSQGNEVVVGTGQSGIKLSLFDVSDMGKPKEIDKLVIGGSGSYSDAFYNHKAVMFDLDRENLGFDAYVAPDDKGGAYKQGALVINFSDDELALKGILDYIEPEVYGKYIPYGRRVLYIGDELYYIQDGVVSSYNYGTLKQIDSIMLR